MKPKLKIKLKAKNHPQYKEMVNLALEIEKDFPHIQARAKQVIIGGKFSGTVHIGIVVSTCGDGVGFIPLYYYPNKTLSKYPVISNDNIKQLRNKSGQYLVGHTIEIASTLPQLSNLKSQIEYGEKDIPSCFGLNTDP